MLISIITQNCMIDAEADFFPSQTTDLQVFFLTVVKIYKFERTSERSVMTNNKHIFKCLIMMCLNLLTEQNYLENGTKIILILNKLNWCWFYTFGGKISVALY